MPRDRAASNSTKDGIDSRKVSIIYRSRQSMKVPPLQLPARAEEAQADRFR